MGKVYFQTYFYKLGTKMAYFFRIQDFNGEMKGIKKILISKNYMIKDQSEMFNCLKRQMGSSADR